MREDNDAWESRDDPPAAVGSKRGRGPSRYNDDSDHDSDHRRSPPRRDVSGEKRQRLPDGGRLSRRLGPLPGDGFGGGNNAPPGLGEGRLLEFNEYWDMVVPDCRIREDAERLYNDYRTGQLRALKKHFFEANKDRPWLKERFHPEGVEEYIRRRNEKAKERCKRVLEDFADGTLMPNKDVKPVSLQAPPEAGKEGKGRNGGAKGEGERRSGNEADDIGDGGHKVKASDDVARDGEENGTRKRDDDDEMQGDGNEGADQEKSPKRQGGDGADGDKQEEEKTEKKLASVDVSRLEHDTKQAGQLASKLDSEKGIVKNPLLEAFEVGLDIMGEDGVGADDLVDDSLRQRVLAAATELSASDKLDVLLCYLWRVHSVDYFGRMVYDRADAGSSRRTGRIIAIMVPVKSLPSGGEDEDLPPEIGEEEKQRLWKRMDATWKARCEADDPLVALLGKAKVEKAEEDAVEGHTRRVAEGKFGCAVPDCKKLFQAPTFVQKHIRNKHPEFLTSIKEATQDDIYLQNVLDDPSAVSEEVLVKDFGRWITPPPMHRGSVHSRLDYGGGPGFGPGGQGPWGGGPFGMKGMPGPGMFGPGPFRMGMPRMMGMMGPGPRGPMMGMRGMMNGGMRPPMGPGPPMGPMFFQGPGGTMMISSMMGGMRRDVQFQPFVMGSGGGMPGRGGRGGRRMPIVPIVPPGAGRGPGPGIGGGDPRGMREYVDLDMPTDDVPVLDYRTAD